MALLFSRSSHQQAPRFLLAPDSVNTLLGAEAFRQRLLELIAGAEKRIYLTALYLQDDEAGREVLDALHAAKALRPGLDIAVLVDWHRAQRGLIGAGKQAGNAAWYRAVTSERATEVPIHGVPVQTRELFGVLHLKGFVIDDRVLYSGASLNNVYLQKFDRYRFDRYHELDCAALADCMAEYVQRLRASKAVHRLDLPECPATRSLRHEIRAFRKKLERSVYHGATTHCDGLAVEALVGVGRNNPLNRRILELLAGARERVVICTPYFNFPKPVRREIDRLLRRGIAVEIIVGDKTANDFYIPPEEKFKTIAALPYLYEINLRRFAIRHQKLLQRGQLKIRLWLDGKNSYHLKGIWIDENRHLITGNNLNPRAFSLDLENALLIHDPKSELAEQKQQELDNIRRHTRLIVQADDLETLQQYPVPVRKLLTRLSRVRMDRLLNRIL